ncbi:hypothetical protein FACS189465_2340 [Clostridia bacterium]|nr:hypothetical protein FACS189465_2340 [Clostridia bacterium]
MLQSLIDTIDTVGLCKNENLKSNSISYLQDVYDSAKFFWDYLKKVNKGTFVLCCAQTYAGTLIEKLNFAVTSSFSRTTVGEVLDDKYVKAQFLRIATELDNVMKYSSTNQTIVNLSTHQMVVDVKGLRIIVKSTIEKFQVPLLKKTQDIKTKSNAITKSYLSEKEKEIWKCSLKKNLKESLKKNKEYFFNLKCSGTDVNYINIIDDVITKTVGRERFNDIVLWQIIERLCNDLHKELNHDKTAMKLFGFLNQRFMGTFATDGEGNFALEKNITPKHANVMQETVNAYRDNFLHDLKTKVETLEKNAKKSSSKSDTHNHEIIELCKTREWLRASGLEPNNLSPKSKEDEINFLLSRIGDIIRQNLNEIDQSMKYDHISKADAEKLLEVLNNKLPTLITLNGKLVPISKTFINDELKKIVNFKEKLEKFVRK